MNENPKRRKKSDNPYILSKDETNDIHVISFKDFNGSFNDIKVSKEIYEIFNSFELDDLSELNEYDNHIEHSEIFENKLNNRIMDKPISIEDEIIKKASFVDVKNAINMLPPAQKRRIKKYYFDDKNEYEIAREEATTQQAINKSLKIAKEKLKKFLKN